MTRHAAHPMAVEGALDHVVEIVRDRLDERAGHYRARGYTLTELERHDLGSTNRLVLLGDAYLELLGWPAGEPPPRPEIAARAAGLDALVLRSMDADRTRARLLSLGFDAGPVVPLSRPARVGDEIRSARFRTVRFGRQPVDGIRLYWCEHQTPECVWQARHAVHPNGARRLATASIAAADPLRVADCLAALAGSTASIEATGASVVLANGTLRVRHDPDAERARIEHLEVDAGADAVLLIDGR